MALFATHLKKEAVSSFPSATFPYSIQAYLLNCIWSGITLPPCSAPRASALVLANGSLTLTISILKRQGQFPPCSRICLHNLIAEASPVTTAPASEFSSPLPPSCVQSYSSFLNLCLSFHMMFPLAPLFPFQPCVMNRLRVAQGARVYCSAKLNWCQ